MSDPAHALAEIRDALVTLVLAAAPSLLPPAPAPAQPLPPWHYAIDCYTRVPDVLALQRATGNFDPRSSFGRASSDLACWRLNQMLRGGRQ